MKASLPHYQQAPRKVRLLADLVRGKSVNEAITMLSFVEKRASEPFQKLLQSAVANAETNFNTPAADLIVLKITVNKGRTLKRSMPRARGSAFPIRKRSSHLEVELGKKGEAVSTKPTTAPVAKAEVVKKAPAKKVAKTTTTKAKKPKTT